MTNLTPLALRLAQAHAGGGWETVARVVEGMVAEIASSGWRPITEAPEKPGTYINVRSTTTYRWLAYKPDGARQMKRPGRWQRATEYGWENAERPDGEFLPADMARIDAGKEPGA